MDRLRKIETKIGTIAILWIGKATVENIIAVFTDRAEAFKECSSLLREGKNAQVTEVSPATPGVLNAARQVWVIADSAQHFTAFCTAESAHARAASITGGPIRVFIADAAAGKALAPGDLAKMQQDEFKAAISRPFKLGVER